MFIGPLGLSPRSSSKLSTVNQRSCDGCFWKAGRTDYYDYERTSTPAGISPNGNSFQTALLEPIRVSIVQLPSLRSGRLKYDPSLPRHSRSQPGILVCLLVQISQQHGCLCGKILWFLRSPGYELE
ncbi:unnamed protein product [Penicillium nalgiovense]|nr:unnamed protein product [Penicillium nalgiovense]CAG8196189.1 unnamed protein product [Penicillium nalgiovense]